MKHFLDRQGSNAYSPSNHRRYTYLLWVGQAVCFQPVTQDFYKFPTPEYNWNYLDELICGYNDELRCVVLRVLRAWCAVACLDVQAACPWVRVDRWEPTSHPIHTTITQTTSNPKPRPETKYRRKLLAVCPGEELLGGATTSPLRRPPPPPQQLEAYLGKLRRLLEQANARRPRGAEPLEVKVAGPVQVGWVVYV